MNVIYDRSSGGKLSSDLNCLDLNLLEEGEKMITSNAAESAGIAILPATALTSAFFKGADIWTNAHGEILSAAEALMTDWVRRQQVALDLWSQSLKQICQCRDPVDLIQTQQDWLCDTHSAERVWNSCTGWRYYEFDNAVDRRDREDGW